jgi:predicted Ser/Thr protein kinase
MLKFAETQSNAAMEVAIGRRLLALIRPSVLDFADGGKKCTKGLSCGGSCISKAKVCVKALNPVQKKQYQSILKSVKAGEEGADKSKANFKASLKADIPDAEKESISAKADAKKAKAKADIPDREKESIAAKADAKKSNPINPYKSTKTLGEGMFGKAVLTDRGTVVKKFYGGNIPGTKIERFTTETIAREMEGLRVMHRLGIGPRPIGIDQGKIEMEHVEGIQIGKMIDGPEKEEATSKAIDALITLHRSGHTHNDAHDYNVIYKTDKTISLIDGGELLKIGEFKDEPGSVVRYARSGYHDINSIIVGEGPPPQKWVSIDNMMEAKGGPLDKFRAAMKKATNTASNAAAHRDLHDEYLKVLDTLKY